MKTHAAVYLGAAVLALLATPLVVRLAKRLGLMDAPGVRKVHKHPIPRVGGIAIMAATLVMVLPMLIVLPALWPDNPFGQAFQAARGQITVLLVGAVFMFLVGLTDDLKNLPAKVKLLCIVGASLAVCATGARIKDITFLPLLDWDLGWWSWPVTVMWIAGVTVALNFMDGLDGLAAGISAIVCAAVAVMSFYSGQPVMGMLMLALLGALTGFLCFNFNPARIFMGDSGSMFLGFMIGAGSVVAAAKKSTVVGIALPALALSVPILDAIFTMVRRRVLDRRSIFSAERGHLHHRLLDRGLQHRNVVLLIYAITALTAGMGMCLLICRSALSLVIFLVSVVGLVGLFHILGVARLGETLEAIRRNRKIARKAKAERSSFEDAQLRVREAKSFESWWQALTGLARKMEFDRLAFSIHDGGDFGNSAVWRRNDDQLLPGEVIHLTIPVPVRRAAAVSWFEVAVRRNGSLETIGRRMMLFGRLLDECARAAALQCDAEQIVAEGRYEIQPPDVDIARPKVAPSTLGLAAE